MGHHSYRLRCLPHNVSARSLKIENYFALVSAWKPCSCCESIQTLGMNLFIPSSHGESMQSLLTRWILGRPCYDGWILASSSHCKNLANSFWKRILQCASHLEPASEFFPSGGFVQSLLSWRSLIYPSDQKYPCKFLSSDEVLQIRFTWRILRSLFHLVKSCQLIWTWKII